MLDWERSNAQLNRCRGAAMVEKSITATEYAESRIEVVAGCIVKSVIAFSMVREHFHLAWPFHAI